MNVIPILVLTMELALMILVISCAPVQLVLPVEPVILTSLTASQIHAPMEAHALMASIHIPAYVLMDILDQIAAMKLMYALIFLVPMEPPASMEMEMISVATVHSSILAISAILRFLRVTSCLVYMVVIALISF
jgi:hypothetical protein